MKCGWPPHSTLVPGYSYILPQVESRLGTHSTPNISIPCFFFKLGELDQTASLMAYSLSFEQTTPHIIRDNLKLSDVVERYPNLKEEVGALNPDYEILSILDGKLVRWSSASCALALACQPYVTQKQTNNSP
jgi:hypothetical protein